MVQIKRQVLHVCTLGRAMKQGKKNPVSAPVHGLEGLDLPQSPPPANQPSNSIQTSSSISFVSFITELMISLLS